MAGLELQIGDNQNAPATVQRLGAQRVATSSRCDKKLLLIRHSNRRSVNNEPSPKVASVTDASTDGAPCRLAIISSSVSKATTASG
jgi:hypothetical protein